MNPVPLFLIIVTLPLLLGGCGEKEEPVAETKPEEPVAETKPAEEAPVNPIKYKITGDAVTITGCDEGTSGKLVIPATIEGKAVTSIGNDAFDVSSRLTSITIPDSVTSIGIYALRARGLSPLTSLTTIEVGAGNVNYTDVNGVLFNKEKTVLHTYPAGKTEDNYDIPDGVTSISEWAFQSCSNLTSITIPEGVTSIGEEAFDFCYSVASITIPDSVTSIGRGAFRGCSSLTSIMIPDGVTSIGINVFMGCESLTSVTIPDSVTSIGMWAFQDCTNLTSVTIPEGVISIENETFTSCKSLTSITIPDSVTSIGYKAFWKCNGLTSITIPEGVTSIGESSFFQCSNLTSLTIPDGVTSIGYGTFAFCSNLTTVTFLGDAPKEGEEIFSRSTPTIYRKPEAKGWGDTFGGRPVKLISEKP